MYLNLMEAQADSDARRVEHQHIVSTLKSLISHMQESNDADLESFWQSCLKTYEETGYDL